MHLVNTEKIVFEIEVESFFWDRPPRIEVFINDDSKYEAILDKRCTKIRFESLLSFGKSYCLKIKRTGKSDDQCIVDIINGTKDQYIIIKKLVVDSIDIKNLIDSRSWYEPDYPKVWYQEKIDQNCTPESKIIGETWLSHNGIWYFNFSSPIYRFVIEQFR